MALQEYAKTLWTIAAPITQEKMNHIEDGIKKNNEALLEMIAEDYSGDISTLSGRLDDVAYTASQAYNTASGADTKAKAGQDALDAINAVIGTSYVSLQAYCNTLENNIGNAARDVLAIGAAVEAARHPLDGRNIAPNTAAPTLADMIAYIYDNLFGFQSTVPTGALTRISNLESLTAPFSGNIEALQNDKVNKADVVQTLTESDTTKVLGAKQGKILKDMIGDGFSSEYTVATAISGARAYTTEQTSEIAGAHRTGVDNDTLNKRFTAVETDVQTIANELSMVNSQTGAIQATNSRVDTIESNVVAMAKEIGMLQDESSVVDLSTAVSRTDTRVDTIESTINNTTTGLAATKNIADTAASNISNLTSRFNAQETIIVNKPAEGSNFNEGVPTVENPVTTADYLIADDNNKYYYWRYFGATTGWQLIGGAGGGGGTGSSSGVILAELPSVSSGDSNIDYFIGNDIDGYSHYRFIEPTGNEVNGHYVKILPNGLIDSIGTTTVSIQNGSDEWPSTETFAGGLTAYAIDDDQHETNLLEDFVAVRNARIQAIYDENEELQSQKLQVLDTNGKLVEYPIVGGGGGSANVYNAHIESSTPASQSIPASSTEPIVISAKVVIRSGNTLLPNAIAEGVIQYRRRGATVWNTGSRIEMAANIEDEKYIIPNNTTFNMNVTKYLQADTTMEFRFALTAHPGGDDETLNVYSSTFRVSQVNLSIAAEAFDYASVKNTNFQFNYRCFGTGISKTVHFLLDGTDIVTPVSTTTNNVVLSQVIPMTGKANGMHTFQVYFVTNTGLESNRLNYYILYNTDNTRQAPLIGAAAKNTTITDGDELIVNYSVYTQGLETTERVEIELYTMDDPNDPSTKNSIKTDVLYNVPNNTLIDPPYSTFSYPKVEKVGDTIPDPKTVYVTLTAYHESLSDSQTVEVTIRYLDTMYDLSPAGEGNLLYSYSAYGHSNNEANKETYTSTYTNISNQTINFTSTFSGFNWVTDGYVDGQSLTIGGGATCTIDVPIFASTKNDINFEENSGINNITQNGRTIEIDYEVLSATNLNDVIIDCMDSASHVGFQITPQSCYLTHAGTEINKDETGFIINEDNIAAAYLTPGQRTHLVFVIEPGASAADKEASFDKEYHQSVNIYVNGEFANSCPYERNKDTGALAYSFSTDKTITIGSDSCLIKLYSVKLYNRGLTQTQVLQNYKIAPIATRDKLERLEYNDILDNKTRLVSYDKAIRKYNCLLLTGPAPTNQSGDVVPTISPYKGSPSPAGRKDNKGNVVGKTESGLTLTKPSSTAADGYTVEFDLVDQVPIDQSIEIPANIGARGAYVSSNNVQGTSSQKYPIHNLKIYLAKWQEAKEAVYEEDENTHKQVLVSEAEPAQIKKVKYSLKGYDENGDPLGTEESTLCWKADYMSTDHANTFNANIADGLFKNDAANGWTISNWASKHYQNTVYGIRCLLFQKQGTNDPEFVADGCLNNDKGNSKTFGLEDPNDIGNDTRSQKWEFTNNSEDLGYFKVDNLMYKPDGTIRAKNGFESCYPDEGDLLEDYNLTPNYNHLQILLTWVSKRARYIDVNDPTIRATKKAIFKNEFTKHFNLNHVLTYYLFLQYTALCDNQVKNMFLRSDNIRDEKIRNSSQQIILDGNSFPEDDPNGIRWDAYQRTSNPDGPDVDEIDWETGDGHSTFAIWAPVLYDLDSCFGAENVGLLKIRYDADWNYTWSGTSQFNGHESILWQQVEDAFKDEIAALALTLYNQYPGLNFRTFNQQQIIENQQQISPALTNQDMILKFDKPWSEGFINYAEDPDASGNYPKQTPQFKYLQRGSRMAQKRQFMQQRSMLLSSLYNANEFKNSAITFRTGTAVGASGNVIGQDDQGNNIYGDGDLTETQITLKANQILYPGIAYGDNKPPVKVLTNNGKVAANTSCTIQATSAVQGNDGIFIYGASVLTDIGDISKFKPLQLNVSAGTNLKRLIIGSDAQNYTNNTTTAITGLNNCVLLEEINVRNLTNMAILNLTANGYIKKVYAGGSHINTISLPSSGILEEIEYGAYTTNITLLNQDRLTSFTYENAENNNYNNVTRLWVENTPNIPVKEIIMKRLAGLKSGGLRVTGLTLDLGNDPSFLELITSDLAKGTYLSATGEFVYGNNSIPTITGAVTIYDIRGSLLNKVRTMYPNLTVTVTHQVIDEFEITYMDDTGTTVLYKDYRLASEHYIDPVYDTNEITGQPYMAMPVKPSDERYDYGFGRYDSNDEYIRFSGWVKDDGTEPNASEPVESITFKANYATNTTKLYTATWHYNDQTKSYTGEYESVIESEAPKNFTMAKIENNKGKVFKGWDKPAVYLTSNIDIYAQWEESTLTADGLNYNENTTDFTTLNAADIYVLSRLSNKNVLADQLGNNPILVQMGQDFNFSNEIETDLLAGEEILKLNGTTAKTFNNIKPLEFNQDWTLAIDYKFLLNSQPSALNSYTLMSCYESDNAVKQGFKLSLRPNNSSSSNTYIDHEVIVTWGNQTQVIDYVSLKNTISNIKTDLRTFRNMLVLHHNHSKPNELEIFYVLPNVDAQYLNIGGKAIGMGTNIINTKITWAQNMNINTPLKFGESAQGIIYWAKYWNYDLGSTYCRQLAAWPHEKIAFYLGGYTSGEATEPYQLYSDTNLTFVAAQGISDRYYIVGNKTLSNNIPVWTGSETYLLLKDRMHVGLPTQYKSIIKQTTIRSSNRAAAPENTYDSSNTYLFLPTLMEVTDAYDRSKTQWPAEEITNRTWIGGPWAWVVENGNLHKYIDTQQTQTVQEVSMNGNDPLIALIRFSSKYITNNTKIFTTTTDPSSNSWRVIDEDEIFQKNISITSGDVWLYNNEIYIYYTLNEINNGSYIDIVAANGGGWRRADAWTLRTITTSSNTNLNAAQECYLCYITNTGYVTINPNTNSRSLPRIICPEFSV